MNGGVKMLFLLISPFVRMLVMIGGVPDALFFTDFPICENGCNDRWGSDALFYLFPHL